MTVLHTTFMFSSGRGSLEYLSRILNKSKLNTLVRQLAASTMVRRNVNVFMAGLDVVG